MEDKISVSVGKIHILNTGILCYTNHNVNVKINEDHNVSQRKKIKSTSTHMLLQNSLLQIFATGKAIAINP
jgi:hypothetical protein